MLTYHGIPFEKAWDDWEARNDTRHHFDKGLTQPGLSPRSRRDWGELYAPSRGPGPTGQRNTDIANPDASDQLEHAIWTRECALLLLKEDGVLANGWSHMIMPLSR